MTRSELAPLPVARLASWVVARLASWGAVLLLTACVSGAPGRSSKPHELPVEAPYDAVIVLGHHPPLGADGAIDTELAQRVERGVSLLRAGRAPRLLLVGGQGVGGATEPAVMAAHARTLGVGEPSMTRDAQSKDTVDNARYARSLLCPQSGPCHARVLLVTSDYHLDRAAKLFRCAGFEVAAVAATLLSGKRERRQQRRHEAMTGFYYLFIDECARAAKSTSRPESRPISSQASCTISGGSSCHSSP